MTRQQTNSFTGVRTFIISLQKRLATILANAGQRCVEYYLNLFRSFADSELESIAESGIEGPEFYELMSLYPELERILFIHIPKCGGTSVRKMLIWEGQCAPIPTLDSGAILQATNYMVFSAPVRSMQRRFLNTVARQSEPAGPQQKYLTVFAGYYVAQSPKRIFILGHLGASDLIPYYRRGRDLFMGTVRAPAEILKSLVAYRVTHTLEHSLQADSVKFLESLQLEIQEFTDLVRVQPRKLTERILELQPALLTNSLAFDKKTDHESVWQGIKDQTVFLAHMSEQALMLGRLFGGQPGLYRENSSDNRAGLAAEFTAALQKEWTEPFVDADSVMLYQKLESAGIIGFWQGGGTVDEYRDLLKNA